MGLFNRNKSQTITELEDYYANKRNRTGMAWLMAFLSLLVTVAVIAALFFGGRWLYRTLVDNDSDSSSTTTSTPAVVSTPLDSNASDEGTADEEAAESTVSQTNSGTNSASNSTSQGVVSDEAARTDTPSSSRSTTSVAGTSSTDLPNTGAGELLIAVPFGAVIAGYMFSRNRQLQK
jgi:hypothetical protein